MNKVVGLLLITGLLLSTNSTFGGEPLNEQSNNQPPVELKLKVAAGSTGSITVGGKHTVSFAGEAVQGNFTVLIPKDKPAVFVGFGGTLVAEKGTPDQILKKNLSNFNLKIAEIIPIEKVRTGVLKARFKGTVTSNGDTHKVDAVGTITRTSEGKSLLVEVEDCRKFDVGISGMLALQVSKVCNCSAKLKLQFNLPKNTTIPDFPKVQASLTTRQSVAKTSPQTTAVAHRRN